MFVKIICERRSISLFLGLSKSMQKKKKKTHRGKKNPSVHITWEPYKNYIFPGSYPLEHA